MRADIRKWKPLSLAADRSAHATVRPRVVPPRPDRHARERPRREDGGHRFHLLGRRADTVGGEKLVPRVLIISLIRSVQARCARSAARSSLETAENKSH